ncbi:MAG TPA: hypothetical protein VF926_11355, partial [Mycobacterium sp.]
MAAGLLLLWLILLLTTGTSITYRAGTADPGLSVRCDPAAWYFWGDHSVSGLIYGEARTFDITDGELPATDDRGTPVFEKINNACDRQRTGAVSIAVLLVVPIMALTWLSTRPRPPGSRRAVI